MANTIKARVGFVSGGHSSMPHYNSFLPLVPSEIKLEQEGLDLYRESLYQIADKKAHDCSPGARVRDRTKTGTASFSPRRRRKSSIRDCSTI